MPISVSCACGANLKAPDAATGKRVKCPKCGNPLVVPAPAADFEFVDDEPAPAPVVAKPVTAKPVAAKPRVLEDEDEPVSPKRTRGAANNDEDDRPKSKRRRNDEDDAPQGKNRRAAADDEDDDRPRKNRRRDDDDEPKKKSALPLILGIVAGAVLVGGGIAAAVLMNQPKDTAKTGQQPPVFSPPTGQNPTPVPPTPVATLTPDELQKRYADYAGKVVTLKTKFIEAQFGKNGPIHVVGVDGKWVLVDPVYGGFTWTDAPALGGDIEVVGKVGGTDKLPALTDGQVASVGLAPPPLDVDAVTLAAERSKDRKGAAAKYDGKLVRVTGGATRLSTNTQLYLTTNNDRADEGGEVITCSLMGSQQGKVKWGADNRITLIGIVRFWADNQAVMVDFCKQADPSKPVEPPVDPSAPLTIPQLTKNFDQYKGKVVTVQGEVFTSQEVFGGNTGGIGFSLAGGARHWVSATLTKPKGWTGFPAVGDSITLKAKVGLTITPLRGLPEGGLELTGVEVVKWTSKGGKDMLAALKSDPPQPDRGDDPNHVVTLTVEELSKDFAKYKGKLVKLTGKFKEETDGGFIVELVHPTGLGVTVTPPLSEKGFGWAKPPAANAEVVFVGTVGGNEKIITLTNAKLAK